MKKILLFSMAVISIFIHASAQTDGQTSINTDIGILTVSKTNDGKDIITISIASWDKQWAGTIYSSVNLPVSGYKRLCLEIADHTRGFCRKGIGFSCSIFDCTKNNRLPNKQVDDTNRLSIVTIKKLKGSVQIIFDNKINWESLGMKE